MSRRLPPALVLLTEYWYGIDVDVQILIGWQLLSLFAVVGVVVEILPLLE